MKRIKSLILVIFLISFIYNISFSDVPITFIKFYAKDSEKTDEEKIDELEKKIDEKSKTIKKNEKEIENLQKKIASNEKKIVSTNESIKKLTGQIKEQESLIDSYLIFLQKLNNKHIWLEQIAQGNILEYAYNFSKVVEYINKDFQKLNSDISTLEVQKKQYNDISKELNDQKEKLEEENKKTNKIYKQLNEELIELEEEIGYEIKYDKSANISKDDRETLMKSVGIKEKDFEYVNYIISHESSWNFKVSNPYSGAYGLCQSLPGEKMAVAGSDWKTNPKTQLTWCDAYAKSRYGSWKEAKEFWIENNWW